MKILHHILRVLLGLFLLVPVAGALGFMPPPTEEMFTPAGWAMMSALTNSGYMMPLIATTCALCSVLFLWNKTALAAVLLAPFTVNVIAFHISTDATVVSAAAIPAYILVVLNLFFLWRNRSAYGALWS